MANRQTQRLSGPVESLLDVSLITTGRLALEREEIDLAELVADVVERFQPQARAAEDVERIFGGFERAVSMRQYGGLGLGLFIARQITEAHGGEIRVRSMPNGGSEFTVLLPMIASEAPSVAPEQRH